MENKTEILQLLALLAFADKEFHDKERDMIKKISKEHGLPFDNIDNIENEITSSEENFADLCVKFLTPIENKQTRQVTLAMLSQLSTADYILHEDEILFLELVADKWGMYERSLREYKP